MKTNRTEIGPEDILRRADCSYLSEANWQSISQRYDSNVAQQEQVTGNKETKTSKLEKAVDIGIPIASVLSAAGILYIETKVGKCLFAAGFLLGTGVAVACYYESYMTRRKQKTESYQLNRRQTTK